MIVAWTGHKPELFADPQAAVTAVASTAHGLVAQGTVDSFLVGGQRGVDTYAALAAIALDVPFTLVLPQDVPYFARGWTPADRATLERTVAAAAEVRIIGGSWDAAFTERNRILATTATLLVAVWTGTRGGGTAETIDLARAAGTPFREVLLAAAPESDALDGRGI